MTFRSWNLVVTCSYVGISKFMHGNKVTEAKMTVHIGFVNLCTAFASIPAKEFFSSFLVLVIKQNANTAWKGSKYEVFSVLCIPVFGLNTEIYKVNLCIQSKYRIIRARRKLHIWPIFMQWKWKKNMMKQALKRTQ